MHDDRVETIASLLLCAGVIAACGSGVPGALPDGGSDGPPAPLPWCDDQDPCTDDRAEPGGCRFDPVEDGRPCSDGDFCTLGDRCQAAQCVPGPRARGPLAQLGALDSLAGGSIGAVGDRFLAVTGRSWRVHVRLAERRGADLAVVASWDGPLDILSASDAIVQPLDGGLVALAGRQSRSLAVFSVPPSGPPALARRAVATLDGQILSLASHGHRLWACTRDFFRGSEVVLVDVSAPDTPSVAGSLRMPRDCGSLATSDDGRRVYVNTQDGVRFIDASPLDAGGDPTLSEVFAPTAGVSTGPGKLILRERNAVRIIRQSDHAEVAALAVAGVLAASLAGPRLVLEGWRATSSGGLEAFAALYDTASAPPVRLDEVVLQRVPFQGDPGSSFRNAVLAGGGALITSIGQRLFDLTGGRFDEQRVPVLTPLDVLARTAGEVRATGYASAAALNVRVPDSPAFAGGGAFGVPIQLETALEDSAPAQLLFGDRSDVPSRAGVGRTWEPDPLVIDRWTLDGDGRPRVTGSFSLANAGAGQLLAAGGGLYRMRMPAAPSFAVALQGWPIAALPRGGEPAHPGFELPVVPAPPFASATGSGRGAFDVDARARRAVVVTSASAASTSEGAVFWLDLATMPPTVVEQIRVDARLHEVRISGTRAVVSTRLELIWLELGKGVVARQQPTAEPFIDHLLGFDGRTAYYSVLDLADGLVVGLGHARFGETGLSGPILPLDDTARTMVEIDGALAIGLRDRLVTVHPHCE